MFELTFGKYSVARKPIINGGAIRPIGLLFIILIAWRKSLKSVRTNIYIMEFCDKFSMQLFKTTQLYELNATIFLLCL